MKNLKTLLLSAISMFLLTTTSWSQSCCLKSATADFAMLGKNESFRSEHLAPLPFHFVPAAGKMITVKTTDGKDASGFEIRAKEKTENYLFVFQEWWGLNDYIKQEAENLYEELGNVNVIALDLYDGKVAATPDEAGKIMGETKDERIRAIINGFLKYAGPSARIQTIGWCFGGGWSLQSSMMAGKNATGCVMYYGMPEKNIEKIKTINFPVLGIFASKDGHITPELVKQFEKDMKENKKMIDVHFYDADHAFANPSNPKFNKEATETAHKLAIAFLREHF